MNNVTNIQRNLLGLFFSMIYLSSVSGQNITVFKSNESVDKTTTKLETIIKSKGLLYFETIDQKQLAATRGIDIPPTKIILFEEADLCAKLIGCQPTTSLDLPLKLMVWEEHGDVYIGYMDPQQMRKRFMISGCDDILAKLTGLHIRVVNEALKEN